MSCECLCLVSVCALCVCVFCVLCVVCVSCVSCVCLCLAPACVISRPTSTHHHHRMCMCMCPVRARGCSSPPTTAHVSSPSPWLLFTRQIRHHIGATPPSANQPSRRIAPPSAAVSAGAAPGRRGRRRLRGRRLHRPTTRLDAAAPPSGRPRRGPHLFRSRLSPRISLYAPIPRGLEAGYLPMSSSTPPYLVDITRGVDAESLPVSRQQTAHKRAHSTTPQPHPQLGVGRQKNLQLPQSLELHSLCTFEVAFSYGGES